MTAAAPPLLVDASGAPLRRHEGDPLIAKVLALPPEMRAEYVAALTNDEALALLYDWRVWARPKQLAPPGKWTTWLNLAGRGYGKTKVGAEWIHQKAKTSTTGRGALIGITYSDIVDTMIEGEAGLLATATPDWRPVFKRQKGRVIYPNGAQCKCFTAEKPRRLRGPQHEFCFVAGTPVRMADGSRRSIESIVVGDVVATRRGPCRVRAVGHRAAPLARARFGNGAELIGTSDHPILVKGRGWVALSELRLRDNVCLWRDDGRSTQRATSIATKQEPSYTSTAWCGKNGAGQSPQDGTSIIATATAPTIELEISPRSRHWPIGESTRCRARSIGALNAIGPSARSASLATARRAASGGRLRFAGSSGTPRATADAAGEVSLVALGTTVVSDVSILGRAGTVYNLSVEGAEEYFANDVLVHNCWIDEIGAFQYPREVYDMTNFGLRIGAQPQMCITTTPKPIELLIELLKDAVLCWDLREAQPGSEILERSIGCVVTTGTSYENRANLSDEWYNRTIKPYEGTRLGDQELLGKLLTDVPGALWNAELIDRTRIKLVEGRLPDLPHFTRIVVACDPAVSTAKASNETGIILAARAENGHAYVIKDHSGRYSPNTWAQKLVDLYNDHDADRIIGEVNNGGDLIEVALRTVDPNVAYKAVRATKGKMVRAEPIAALYEQGKVHHVGTFGLLESQMCTWVPDSGLASPDRMDAAVWALTDLMLKGQGVFVA